MAYKYMSAYDLVNCRSVYAPHCPGMGNLIPSSMPSCEWALFTGDKYTADTKCDHIVYPSYPPPSLSEIQLRKFMFTSMAGTLAIHCDRQVNYISLSNQTIVEIPCLCSATNEHVLIPEQYCKSSIMAFTPL